MRNPINNRQTIKQNIFWQHNINCVNSGSFISLWWKIDFEISSLKLIYIFNWHQRKTVSNCTHYIRYNVRWKSSTWQTSHITSVFFVLSIVPIKWIIYYVELPGNRPFVLLFLQSIVWRRQSLVQRLSRTLTKKRVLSQLKAFALLEIAYHQMCLIYQPVCVF